MAADAPAPTPANTLRPEVMLAKPVFLESAFKEPERVLTLVRDSAPYRLAAAVHRSRESGTDVPWFRVFWAYGEKLADPRADFIFNNPRFIQAARESFGAEVVIPSSLMNNLNTPMAGGVPHLDLPHFRGAERFPFDLLVAMGYSGLFHPWAIPIASALSWFYRGPGGDFDYWPDGPDEPRFTLSAPLWNQAVVADNEYMFHRVGGVGRDSDHVAPGAISRAAKLHHEDGAWSLVDGDSRQSFSEEAVRLSVLWKAYAFKDGAALRVFRDRSDDLTLPQALSILSADLDQRGLGRLDVEAGYGDEANRRLIHKVYRAPEVRDASRRRVQ
ncbi:MAG: hypothetical protein OEZ06_13555 [Myxococcales bacterium]|nr:hypothetical protein [Myxococcales bacterium]